MLSQHATHFIVYSPGRTGSMLLARNLGATLRTLHDPVPVRHIYSVDQYDQQITNTLNFDVLQTHVLTNKPSPKYTRVFNIRLDVVETVLSLLLSHHYRAFHVAPTEPEPFIFLQKGMLSSYCKTYINWYRYYAHQLTLNDHVVVYETMMENLSNEPNRRVFQDKKKLLVNFNEVFDVISSYKEDMTNSLQSFIQHQNPWEIHKFINYSIQF